MELWRGFLLLALLSLPALPSQPRCCPATANIVTAHLTAILTRPPTPCPTPQALQTLTSQACLAGSLSASSLLGVVGPPSGLPPIGNLGLSLGAAATPSCPTTPVGTPRTAMRRLSAGEAGARGWQCRLPPDCCAAPASLALCPPSRSCRPSPAPSSPPCTCPPL